MKRKRRRPSIDVTELRKLEKKVATARRQLTSEVNRAYSAGDNKGIAKKGERLEQELAALAGVIADRIEERRPARRGSHIRYRQGPRNLVIVSQTPSQIF